MAEKHQRRRRGEATHERLERGQHSNAQIAVDENTWEKMTKIEIENVFALPGMLRWQQEESHPGALRCEMCYGFVQELVKE